MKENMEYWQNIRENEEKFNNERLANFSKSEILDLIEKNARFKK